MIRAKFSIVDEQPNEGERYPQAMTLAEFNIEAEVSAAIVAFQQALTALTQGRGILVLDGEMREIP